MRILVLGSDGQIGRPLTTYLRSENEVVEFDNFSNPITDLRIPDILNNILREIDFVFFLAFDVGGSVYLKRHQDTYEFISNNIKIMNNTFDSLRRSEVPFIFASSQMSDMGHSTYGILKRIGEKYTYSIGGKVLKFWNVYGQQKCTGKSFVITDFISMAKKRNRIDMLTDGQERRQFLYVMDCCKCLNIVMNRFRGIKEDKLDVTSFEWRSIKDIAMTISALFDNCPIYPGQDKDDVQRSALIDPERDILKYWQPETSIEMGIKNIILYE